MPVELTNPRARRDVALSMRRGWKGRCPNCGEGALFGRYLKVVEQCRVCGEELHHHRADDAPAYFTILIVAHIVVGGVVAVHKAWAPPDWVQLVVWLPLTALLCLWFLPRVKGVLVGLQWSLYMHGFETARAGQIAPSEGRGSSL